MSTTYPKTKNLQTTKPWFWMRVDDLIQGSLGDKEWFGDSRDPNDVWLKKHKASSGHFQELMDSIQKDGFRYPVGVDKHRNQYLTNGHHRLTVALLLGYEYIPATTYFAEDGYKDKEWLFKRKEADYEACDDAS